MFPVTVGLNHRSAPVEIREKMSFNTSQMSKALKDLSKYPCIQGIVILSTCNRLEVYTVTTNVEIGINSIKRFLAQHGEIDEQQVREYLYVHTSYDAVHHLFRVVSGLDSMVLGETQILGQVATAYEEAYEAKVTNKVMNVLFQNALTVGKRVRTETLIDQHPVSISYTAVELAEQKFGELCGKSILILGAGEMSALTVKHLVAAGASTVLVSNRSYDRAVFLAQEFSGQAVHFEQMDEYLAKVDIVISATASTHFVLMPNRLEQVMGQRNSRPLLIIDIAVPRDIHPDAGKLEGVTLYDIDDLQGVVDKHHHARELAAKQADKIIDDEMIKFLKWHNSLYVIPTIISFQQKAEQIKETQLNRALERLGGLTPKQEKVVRSMANSIVNQLLHIPITNLKELADTRQGHLYTEILQNLFDLDVSEETNYSSPMVKHPGQVSQGG
ncbi:MAG: glutamyl-tRNA reductase [Desulfitobacteriaceae bacterium]